MNFSQAVQSVFSQYTNFRGRARRAEYWYFVLLDIIVTAVISAIVSVLHFGDGVQSTLTTLWQLAILLPFLGVTVRRLHDIGKSGWNILFALIPLVGEILLIVWLARDSQPGTNNYGTSGKYPNGIPFHRPEGHDYSTYTNHSPTSKASYYQPPQSHAAESDFVNKSYDEVDSGVTCPHCGAKNVARSRFCTTCGASFE